jgi:hypothetical protein
MNRLPNPLVDYALQSNSKVVECMYQYPVLASQPNLHSLFADYGRTFAKRDFCLDLGGISTTFDPPGAIGGGNSLWRDF